MRFAAFFRNLNLGRAGSPSRDQLVAALEASGASGAVSFQAHGNTALSASGIGEARRVVREACGRITEVSAWADVAYVRSMKHLASLVDSTPFANTPTGDIHERCVTFLPADAGRRLALPISGPRGDFEVLHVLPGEAFSVTRLIGGRPGNVTVALERRLGTPLSTRNWNTVMRLLDRHA